MEKDYNTWIKEQLEDLQEPEYQKFSSRILPGICPILGVRLPLLRNIAKKLAKDDWSTYLEHARDDSMEEIMLQGMTLGYAKGNLSRKEPYLRKFIPKIDNWSVCDSVCSSIKLAKEQPEEMWEFLQDYLHSKKEYEIRFGLVQLLNYYIKEEYLDRVLQEIDRINNGEYYVMMAQAWALSICYRDFPKETEPFLKQNHLDEITHNKAIQKITESRKVGKEEKNYIRTLRR